MVIYNGLASEFFGDTTSHGRPVLGSPIRTPEYILSLVNERQGNFGGGLQNYTLHHNSQFADSQPHAVYSALTHGLYNKQNYLARTTSAIENLLSPLEDWLIKITIEHFLK